MTVDKIQQHVNLLANLFNNGSNYDKMKLTVMGGELFLDGSSHITV